MKRQTITIHIQRATTVSPRDCIRVYLSVISQHHGRSATGNIHTTESLHQPFAVHLLVKNNFAVSDFQTTFIGTSTLYNQRTFTYFMQIVALHAVNLPSYGSRSVHNNTGPDPSAVVCGCHSVIITEGQRTSSLRNRIFQVNLTIMPHKYQIFTSIQIISCLPVHGIFSRSLAQGTDSCMVVKIPFQCYASQ